MSKVYLIIAGHGHQRDGSFDPGATGFITKGEYRYMVENLFPLMKKYIPKDAKVIFYDRLKVSNHGNLVRLVNEYGADEVIEFHYDAFTNQARGGHVNIHSDYSPDDMDLRIRDGIGEMVGLRFTHKGHQGISGRSNLYNVNMARNNGIPYRLLELGFGTNRTDADIMVKQADKYAKLLVEAILGAKVENSKPAIDPVKPLGHSYTVQSGDTLSAIAKKYDTTIAALAKHNELSDPNLIRVGEDIEIPIAVSGPAPTPKPVPTPKTPANTSVSGAILIKNENGFFLATDNIKVRNAPRTTATHTGTLQKGQSINYKRVFEGNGFRWLEYSGNSGNTLYLPYRRLTGDTKNWGTFHATRPNSTPAKTIDQMAREIINDPSAPVGHENRRKWLGISQVQYEQVRRRVNQLA